MIDNVIKNASLKSRRVDKIDRAVCYIGIEVASACKSDGILADKAAAASVKVSGAILKESGLNVELSSRIAKRIL